MYKYIFSDVYLSHLMFPLPDFNFATQAPKFLILTFCPCQTIPNMLNWCHFVPLTRHYKHLMFLTMTF